MPDALQRGAVVVCGRRFSVVWGVDAAGLVLLPIIDPREPKAHDVPLSLGDLVACAVTIPNAVIRPRPNAPVGIGRHVVVGTVPGATMCKVVVGVARVFANEACETKWGKRADRIALSDERAVNMVKS